MRFIYALLIALPLFSQPTSVPDFVDAKTVIRYRAFVDSVTIASDSVTVLDNTKGDATYDMNAVNAKGYLHPNGNKVVMDKQGIYRDRVAPAVWGRWDGTAVVVVVVNDTSADGNIMGTGFSTSTAAAWWLRVDNAGVGNPTSIQFRVRFTADATLGYDPPGPFPLGDSLVIGITLKRTASTDMMRLYVDGVKVDSLDVSALDGTDLINNDNHAIGGFYGGSQYTDIEWYEFQVDTTARSDAWHAAYYEWAKGAYNLDPATESEDVDNRFERYAKWPRFKRH